MSAIPCGSTAAAVLGLALAAALPAKDARVQTYEHPTVGEIPGNRGELVLPYVPGPPTYTKPESSQADDRGELSKGAQAYPKANPCEPAQRTYLDPQAARSAPVLDVEQLYDGWLAGGLIGQDVYGKHGEQLGEVQDILVGPDHRVTAITVEGGGFLEIGDAAFRVPWNMVDFEPGRAGVRVELTSEQASRQGLFDGPEVVDTGPREFRVSEVRGDWTRVGNETDLCFTHRGRVRDVVFSRDGRILAIIESRAARLGGGAYAYPFFTYQQGWRSFYGYYDLPVEKASAPAPRVDLSRFGRPGTVGAR